MADPTTTVFRAASWLRERFYLSNDQRRGAGVAPTSWEANEPVADRERWKVRKVTRHGFKVSMRSKCAGDWRTKAEWTGPDLGKACEMARAWVATESEGR